MASSPAAVAADFAFRLTAFEAAFIRTVLEHHGVSATPSLEEFSRALAMLKRYDELCLANPGYESHYAPRLDSDDMASLRAKAFVMFRTITPSPAQWHKAHAALFGPLLCETCG